MSHISVSFSYVTTVSDRPWQESNRDQSIINSTLHDFMYVGKSEKLHVHMSAVEGGLFYIFWLFARES